MAGDIHGPTFNASLGISLRNLDLSIGFNWLRYNYSNDSDDDYNPYWKDGITGRLQGCKHERNFIPHRSEFLIIYILQLLI
jgi:hypothetical protein